jgi:hypothetical protein
MITVYVTAVVDKPGEGNFGEDVKAGEISVAKSETFKIDTTAPNAAEVNYNNRGLRAFLNTITFGRFFKARPADPVIVEIAGYDQAGGARSGVASVAYVKNTVDFADNAAVGQEAASWPDSAWTMVNGDTASFDIQAADKGTYHIFTKVTDVAGNYAIFYDSAVVYVDSAQSGQDKTFTRFNTNDISDIAVTLNGNSVASIVNTSNANEVLAEGIHYSVDVSSGTITLKNAYLLTLSASSTPYTFEVSYAPQGVSYVDDSGGDAISETPLTTTFTVKVNDKQSGDDEQLIPGKGSGVVHAGDEHNKGSRDDGTFTAQNKKNGGVRYSKNSGHTAKTGDDTNLAVLSIAGIIAIIVLIILLFNRHRQTR